MVQPESHDQRSPIHFETAKHHADYEDSHWISLPEEDHVDEPVVMPYSTLKRDSHHPKSWVDEDEQYDEYTAGHRWAKEVPSKTGHDVEHVSPIRAQESHSSRLARIQRDLAEIERLEAEELAAHKEPELST